MKIVLIVLSGLLFLPVVFGSDLSVDEMVLNFEHANSDYESNTSNVDLCEKAAIAAFGLVRAERLEYLKVSTELFGKALKLNDQARFHAYLGSCYLIKAREVSKVIDKIEYVNKGLPELDLAVSMAPKSVLTVYIRAESTINLPDFFNRLDQVTKDLDFLLNLYEKSPGELEKFVSPRRLFELKASELDLRKKPVAANDYRKKAKEFK